MNIQPVGIENLPNVYIDRIFIYHTRDVLDEHLDQRFVVRLVMYDHHPNPSWFRDELSEHLHKCDIQTLIHYPIPPHKQEAYSEFNILNLPFTEKIHNQILSIPIGPEMSDEEVNLVVKSCNIFRK